MPDDPRSLDKRFQGRADQTLPKAARDLADAWGAMAEIATDLANARRTLFLAYVAEGFTEAQALELVKAP